MIASARLRVWNARPFLAAACVVALGGCIQPNQPTLENGTVLAATPVDQPGENTGAGAVTGMVVLGAAGGSVGAGAGKAVAVIAGVIAGEEAGSAIEAAAQKHDGIAYTIQLADGRVVTVIEHVNKGDPIFGLGAAVTLETSGHEQHVLARET
jgi:outer membrane lipoprotein SlyB